MRIFLSSVTAEFGNYRAPVDQAISGLTVDVDTQNEMGGVTHDLILTLDNYVQRADLVLHMAGERAGTPADNIQTAAVFDRHPQPQDATPKARAARPAGRPRFDP